MISEKQKDVITSFTRHLNPEDVFDVREDWDYMFKSKFKVDYRLVSKIPGGLKNKTVLNIGTFFPIDEIYFASHVKQMYSVDIAEEIINVANEIADKEIHPSFREKIKIKVSDAANLPFENNYFDVAFSFSTLEHIPEKEKRDKAFSEIARVTKKSGFVILTVPNKLNIGKYLKSLSMQKRGSSPFGYEHHYTPKELRLVMLKNGLRPIYFASSAGDYSGIVTTFYDLLFRKFGHRMGWLGQKM
jgi:ubiquinone/menaquinone biosynthesis C-methylase UbiE